MTDEENVARIVAFARHCGGEDRAPEAVARRRGWLDDHNVPTAEGARLLDALDEQEATRTVFRPLP